jgi:SAM-dependent methyltransferase
MLKKIHQKIEQMMHENATTKQHLSNDKKEKTSVTPDSRFYTIIRSYEEYLNFQEKNAFVLDAQRKYEDALWGNRSEFTVTGYCSACKKVMDLRVDLQWGNGIVPNWRERLECSCECNNRVRAAVDFLSHLTGDNASARLYATEQVTALYQIVKSRFPGIIGSEYLRDGTATGSRNAAGIRHEDVTALTLASESIDVVLSFDVLEHVPEYRKAFRELARVTAKGGHLLASFPFDTQQPKTVVRATIEQNGSLTHHLPPEYHGDPVDSTGCLCFQVFGWDVLEELRSAGFSDAWTAFYWSPERGYLGPNQLLIVARR